MRKFLVEDNLQRTLNKLFKKDKTNYEAVMKKFEEILSCKNINHYKNLRKPLQHLKRVHVRGPFILTFKYIESKDKIIFYNFDHHNNIYE